MPRRAGARCQPASCGQQGALMRLREMFPRLGISRVLGLVLQIGGGALAESEPLRYLVVFYPVRLGLATASTVVAAGKTARRSHAARPCRDRVRIC